jgi:hypothetical protein
VYSTRDYRITSQLQLCTKPPSLILHQDLALHQTLPPYNPPPHPNTPLPHKTLLDLTPTTITRARIVIAKKVSSDGNPKPIFTKRGKAIEEGNRAV